MMVRCSAMLVVWWRTFHEAVSIATCSGTYLNYSFCSTVLEQQHKPKMREILCNIGFRSPRFFFQVDSTTSSMSLLRFGSNHCWAVGLCARQESCVACTACILKPCDVKCISDSEVYLSRPKRSVSFCRKRSKIQPLTQCRGVLHNLFSACYKNYMSTTFGR
jgi:hypothetical protein